MDGGQSFVWQVLDKVFGQFLAPGSMLSLTSLGCALCLAAGFIAVKRRRRHRRIRPWTILRVLFPRRIVAHASTRIDFSYLIFNTFIFGVILGWALLSFKTISDGTSGALTAALGGREAAALPELASRIIITLGLFIAYEFGYWVHHYLCHRVPLLWEFHKVHHTANVLTPMTVFRVHPVDTWLFVNILALTVGAANGAATYALGAPAHPYVLTDTNLILVLFIHLYIHFQHSHLWIAFRGVAGRLLISPAHHQVHHSNNPIHFNKNLGSCLAIWDWLFGTLYVPAGTAEKLSFGVEPDGRDAQTITEAYVASFHRAAEHAMPQPAVADDAGPAPETAPREALIRG